MSRRRDGRAPPRLVAPDARPHATRPFPIPSHKLPARQDDPLRLRGRAAEREVEHEQHDDDGGGRAHGHVLPVLAARREVCERGRFRRARRENSMESDANNSEANNGRTPSHTSSVRRDAVARPQLAGREVRVSGRPSLMIPVTELARAHAAVAHGGRAQDLYASTRAAR